MSASIYQTVRISAREYANLIAAQDKLDKLEAAGVDNWEGYAEAMADDDDDYAPKPLRFED